MDQYIKTDGSNNIIDTFFDFQKNKFDGTEILFESDVTPPFKQKINGKSISNEFGTFIFTWDGSDATEKTSTEIETEENINLLPEYKTQKIAEGRNILYTQWPDSSKTVTALKNQYLIFKTNVQSATTIAEVDTELTDFITFIDIQ